MSRWRDKFKVHPVADVFPMMSDAELRVLGEDIKANGLQTTIVFDGSRLLAGRNRLEAMERAGVELKSWHTRDFGKR
jgi:ParB-like chromosome segregation protein Spo0J